MQALDLTRVAEELYGLPPGGFIGVREERVRQARDAGDFRLAGAIKKLRRPTVSAWVVNQLSRQAEDQIAELLRLGEELREAQRNLNGDLLRELAVQRRELVGALLQRGQRLADDAGVVLSAQARREVASTLEAALGDPAAAELVQSGRLTIALSFVGLGAAEVAEPIKLRGPATSRARGAAVRPEESKTAGQGIGGPGAGRGATRPSRARSSARPGVERSAQPRAGQPGTRRGSGQTTARRGTEERAAQVAAERAIQAAADRAAREAAAAERAKREAAAARQSLREAGEQVQAAQVALEEAERRVQAARQERDDARGLVAELEVKIAEARSADSRATRDLRDAKRGRDLAARTLEAAQRRLAQAWTRASKSG
ncbi:MAG TPA: hypothetical protein VGS19_02645 [Streptosporangiaceae bacterium]|nr:hypothetical protein [Streptosporangiaceae bacterium]